MSGWAGRQQRNMREQIEHEGLDNLIRLSPVHDDIIQVFESSRERTMAAEEPRNGGVRVVDSRRRKSRSVGINTRTALLSILATAPAAMAADCISLSGSTVCPAFDAASISTDTTQVGLLYVSSQ